MELMRAYRTERGPGLTPLVPSIVAGRGRERWRGLCHVRPRGCAWRAYASDAPRPQARRRHRPRPWSSRSYRIERGRVSNPWSRASSPAGGGGGGGGSAPSAPLGVHGARTLRTRRGLTPGAVTGRPPGALCVSHCAGAVPQTPGAEHRRRAGSGAVATALPRPPPRACMAHAYASDTLRSHARRRHTGRAMGLMCVYRTGRGPGLTPLVPGIVAGRGWGSGGEGSAPSAPVGMHGARTRHTRRALKPGAATGRAPGAYARVALSGGRASTLESRASSPGGVGGCGEGPAPSTPVGVHGARYASDAPGPHAQRRHTGRAPGAHVHVPH